MSEYRGTIRETGASRIVNVNVNVTVDGSKLLTFNQMKSNLVAIEPFAYLCYLMIGVGLSVDNIWFGPIFFISMLIVFALKGNDFACYTYLLFAILGLTISYIELNVIHNGITKKYPGENAGISFIIVMLMFFAFHGRTILKCPLM